MIKSPLYLACLICFATVCHAESGDPFNTRSPSLDSALPGNGKYPPGEPGSARAPVAPDRGQQFSNPVPSPMLDRLQLIAVANNSALLRVQTPGVQNQQVGVTSMSAGQTTGQMMAMTQVQTIDAKTITIRDGRSVFLDGQSYLAEISEEGDEVRLYLPSKGKNKTRGEPVWVGQLNGPALIRPQVSPMELLSQPQTAAGTGLSQLVESGSGATGYSQQQTGNQALGGTSPTLPGGVR